ncbi:hypothetical protein Fmac_000790 [Flemingia macrophylla]|uniref:Uncharacterized protein n=1 Tax=Flemingia macrophylla TaxID=520843 RepID=A0ABD1NI17_9FABA
MSGEEKMEEGFGGETAAEEKSGGGREGPKMKKREKGGCGENEEGVPFHLRRLNEDAYTPRVVSIGPFHHNTLPHLRNMERYKLSYCKYFLHERTRTTSDTWIHYIESVEPQIRRCYSETLPFSKEELVNIIFVDSGFILELFCRYCARSWSDGECVFQHLGW